MSFTSGDTTPLDSVTAMNVRTGEMTTFAGNETLILAFGTGIDLIENQDLKCFAYPNPFDGQTSLDISIPESGNILITVRNQLGQLISRESKFVQAGNNNFTLSVETAGNYSVEVACGEKAKTIQLISTAKWNNGNSLTFTGTSPVVDQPIRKKSISSANRLDFILGDCIRYTCKGDVHTTIFQEEPRNSRAYRIVFSPCIDPVGKSYSTVKIGDQIWMAENLAYLPEVSPPSAESSSIKHYYVYGYDGSNINEAKGFETYLEYGVLYNWEAAMVSCPDGWHIPTDFEWKTIEGLLGMNSTAQGQAGWRISGNVGEKLKSCTGWYEDGCGINECGLNLTPAGWQGNDIFNEIGQSSVVWSASYIDDYYAYYRWTKYDTDAIYKGGSYKRYATSVRCIKDE